VDARASSILGVDAMKRRLTLVALVTGFALGGCAFDAAGGFDETVAESQEGLTYTFGSLPALPPDGDTPVLAAPGTAPALVRNTCGLHAFVRGNNDRIYTATESGGSWSAWTKFGRTFSSSPGAGAIFTTTESCSIMVVARQKADNALLFRVKRTGSWESWQTIPGLAPGSFDDVRQPAVVFGKSSTAAAAVHVIFPTDDAKLRWTKLTSLADNAWTAWTVLPNGANGNVQSSPSATSTVVGNGGFPIRIAVRGGNGKLWHTGLTSIGGPDWTEIPDRMAWTGGGLTSRMCGDVPTYYATIADNAVFTNRGPNLLWQGWDQSPDKVTTSAPAIAASACNAYDIAYQREGGRFTRVKVQ
jgi:hypothetical protein